MRSKLFVCLFVLFVCVSAASAQYVEIYRIDQLAKDLPEDKVIGAAAAWATDGARPPAPRALNQTNANRACPGRLAGMAGRIA